MIRVKAGAKEIGRLSFMSSKCDVMLVWIHLPVLLYYAGFGR